MCTDCGCARWWGHGFWERESVWNLVVRLGTVGVRGGGNGMGCWFGVHWGAPEGLRRKASGAVFILGVGVREIRTGRYWGLYIHDFICQNN